MRIRSRPHTSAMGNWLSSTRLTTARRTSGHASRAPSLAWPPSPRSGRVGRRHRGRLTNRMTRIGVDAASDSMARKSADTRGSRQCAPGDRGLVVVACGSRERRAFQGRTVTRSRASVPRRRDTAITGPGKVRQQSLQRLGGPGGARPRRRADRVGTFRGSASDRRGRFDHFTDPLAPPGRHGPMKRGVARGAPCTRNSHMPKLLRLTGLCSDCGREHLEP